MATYRVQVELPDYSHYDYYEEADTAQDAVDYVRCYMTDEEVIVEVSRVVRGWK